MSEETNTSIRLSKAAKEFNVSSNTIIDFLTKKGFNGITANTKLSDEMYSLQVKEYRGDRDIKSSAQHRGPITYKGGRVSVDTIAKKQDLEDDIDHDEVIIRTTNIGKPIKEESKQGKNLPKDEAIVEQPVQDMPSNKPVDKKSDERIQGPKVIGKLDLDNLNGKKKQSNKPRNEEDDEVKPIANDVVKEEDHKVEPPVEVVVETKDIDNHETKVETIPVEEVKPSPEPVSDKGDDKVEPAVVKPEEKNEGKTSKFIGTEYITLSGPTVLGKIELPTTKKPKSGPAASSDDNSKKKKRKRIKTKPEGSSTDSAGETKNNTQQRSNNGKPSAPAGKPNAGKQQQGQARPLNKKDKGKHARREEKVELTEEEIQKQIKDTIARLSPMGKSQTSKHRRDKRKGAAEAIAKEMERQEEEKRILKVTEFVTANELATMMNIPINKVLSTCMSLGYMVSINQRLDAEVLAVVASEFDFQVEFVSADVQEALAGVDEPDREEDLVSRAPVVTVMGHVDHGKTKLLDYIRKSNVVAGEAGGITQHIGAYEVVTENGKKITFLDTPGHEAFTAMRARGAQVTDVAIIVIAADDSVMPQTVEAINHAMAANVPIVFAFNKIDKPTANTERIREQLANMSILVEEWGGKYQTQEISAKSGLGVDQLLEKVLLEAEMLDLKGNPKKAARGTIIESALDKGRGYIAKILVQNGTLKVGDMVLAGTTYGKVKAMFNERNQALKEAGPSVPLLLLGLNGAPQPGDSFVVMNDEKEAKSIANRRMQLQREMSIRTNPHITLDEIGRRIAIGDFKELNIIVKADFDGSVEALADSLLKLSTEEVKVNVIHKSVGAISESDVNLASASNAIIVGFQVRPTVQARKLAENEKIDIRLYSIIYTAIEEIKAAIEGMLTPDIEEVITCNIEIRETFKVSKVGTIAGCMVLDGKVNRNTKIRVIRDGIVIFTGTLGSLKRYKDDVKEVAAGYECGLNIEGYNDIKVGDIIEGYTEKEIGRKL